jgi:hypothetical protein
MCDFNLKLAVEDKNLIQVDSSSDEESEEDKEDTPQKPVHSRKEPAAKKPVASKSKQVPASKSAPKKNEGNTAKSRKTMAQKEAEDKAASRADSPTGALKILKDSGTSIAPPARKKSHKKREVEPSISDDKEEGISLYF